MLYVRLIFAMKKLFVLLLIFYAIFTIVQGECDGGCALPIAIYKDLKCVPEYETPDSCCPIQYDCSHIYNITEKVCHLRGKLYNPSERVKAEAVRGSCKQSCRCQIGPAETHFYCSRPSDSCPERAASKFLKSNCYLQYELNRCCATGQACPPFENITQCEVNGTIYKEGQMFNHPTEKCKKCVCKKGFEGKFEEQYCQEVQCFAELKYSGAIDDYCAPFYNTRNTCCPNKWVCPSKNGKFLPVSKSNSKKENVKCTFGNETVPIGGRYEEEFENQDKIHCRCVIPPLMSCGPKPIKL